MNPTRRLAVLRDLNRLRPGNARHLGCLGHALKERGLSAEAGEILEAAAGAGREEVRRKPNLSLPHQNLANALRGLGRFDEAIAEYRTAIRINADDSLTHNNLGNVLEERGRLEEAIAEYRAAIRLAPAFAAAHQNLGFALQKEGKLEDAIAEYRTAIRLNPDYAECYDNLGSALRLQGKFDEAIAASRRAVRLKPDYAAAHNNLGMTLKIQGKLEEAIAEFRAASRLKPDDARPHVNLGVVFVAQGKLDLAVAEYHAAIQLAPDLIEAHNNLSIVLQTQGKLEEAIAEYRNLLKLNPDYAGAHFCLGTALFILGRHDEAAAEYRATIRLKPDFAEAHCNLGQILLLRGDYAEALEMYRKGHELGSKTPGWAYPSAQWVADAERKLAFAKRLPAIIRGEDKPKDDGERLAFAQMAYDGKQFKAAHRLWAEALEGNPKVGDDRQSQVRYSAACAAALVAAGKGKDQASPDGAEEGKLRGQALDWIKAELTAWGKLLESGPPQARVAIAAIFKHWKEDTDLTGIRDALALAKLPEEEQKAWRALWTEVQSIAPPAHAGNKP